MQKEAVDRSSPRPGGRSARVQKAVHRAVRELQADGGEGELTVPAVAARAGVTTVDDLSTLGDAVAAFVRRGAGEVCAPKRPPLTREASRGT